MSLVPRAAIAAAIFTLLAGCAPAAVATPRVTPGTAGAPREVNVIAKEWTYVPSAVDLVAGETVLLHLLNGGTEPHEWVFGDNRVQAAWEAAEAAVAGAPPGPTPLVTVPAAVGGLRVTARSGERVDVAWNVPGDGPAQAGFLLGCHIPGHFANGMAVHVRWIGRDGLPVPTGLPASPGAPAGSGGRRWYAHRPRRCSGPTDAGGSG